MRCVVVTLTCVFLALSPPGEGCRSGEYEPAPGMCCPLCDKGSVVLRDCTDESSTNCRPCESGTYMDADNGRSQCMSCRPCIAEQGLGTQRECSRVRDSACSVLDGFYCQASNQESGCSLAEMHTRCTAGQTAAEPELPTCSRRNQDHGHGLRGLRDRVLLSRWNKLYSMEHRPRHPVIPSSRHRSQMEDYHKPDQQTVQALANIATRLRINSIKATTAAGSGHPTSCSSVAEIMSVLFFNTMKYRPEDPKNIHNDRFVLSKGHAAPILYAVWAETGYLKESELLNLRKVDSILEGHPVPKQQFVDVATGSLGQGLGAACGMAYTGKYFDKASYRVFCLLGDGEMSEGSVWEAMSFASYYQLDNLVAVLDINRLGQSDPTPLQHHTEKYQRRCEAFGWQAVVVDGHSVEELCKVLNQPRHQPLAIIAKTIKGKGISVAEDKLGWHGKPLPREVADGVLKELQSRIVSCSKRLYPAAPCEDAPAVSLRNVRMPSAPSYKLGEKVATRKAYGMALAKLGRYNQHVIALDGDTKNSTFAELFKNEHPDRYVECYIAEQNMVSVAVGCAARDRSVVFASTFATFFTRAYDQLRMAAISESNVNLCGSHCGVSIGEDGPSQMGLEDLAMFRAIPTATVFYPSDAVSTEKAMELAANTKGLCYIRTSRPENSVIYNSSEDFHVGQAKVVNKTNDDHVTVIGAGVTLHEAMAAAEQLKKERINVRVIDPFTIKPLDSKTIIDNAKATRGRIITVEDHYYEGGLGEAVCAAVVNETGFSVHRMAVAQVPRSGKPQELLRLFGIDRDAIAQAVRKVLSTSANNK
ncbi:transketolase isoform X1 [Gadus morhua]|uniref:transketolase isoform X1 n=3 Tax=Gadus morhua TaxID=8049 RepID=UPI0011B6E4C8|nr:transketolase-like isoform X1 [Gadus morhua]